MVVALQKSSFYSYSAYNICVEDFMVKDVKFVPLDITYFEIFTILKNTKYRAFPLVDTPGKLIDLKQNFGDFENYITEIIIAKDSNLGCIHRVHDLAGVHTAV